MAVKVGVELSGPAAATAIDYSAPPGASFTAEEVTIPVATYSLAGTLLVPKTGKTPYPAVVMITARDYRRAISGFALPGLEQVRAVPPDRRATRVEWGRGAARR